MIMMVDDYQLSVDYYLLLDNTNGLVVYMNYWLPMGFIQEKRLGLSQSTTWLIFHNRPIYILTQNPKIRN